jgi:DHA1 family bicyclomycin/chloramphenicol resistance-like MFS transporter
MDGYHLTQQQFAIAFGFNAFGIILLSSINKRLANRFSVIRRLTMGGLIQVAGALIIVGAGLMSHAPLVVVMLGLFLTVSGIGFTGPNAMALAMSEQGSRAGTASAIMGSTQFACGLLGGVVLNFLVWNHLFNMGILMLAFTVAGFLAILKVSQQLKLKQLS